MFSPPWLSKGAPLHLRELFLRPTSKYKEYIHRTQASKSTSILSIVQTGNASVCLSHIFGPWILDSRASYHISSNKIVFSSLIITLPLPMITLTNGSQTMAKEIGSASPLPTIPLTLLLYVPYSPFNMLSISKLTRDLNCLITFSDNSVTLQDQSTRRTIGIGREFQGLFHLSSPSSSTACTFMQTSFQPKPRSVSSSVIPGFNEVIVATPLIHIDTLSLSMSPFLRTLLCSLPPTLPVLTS